MSVTDINKKIIITDCLTGKVIVSLPYDIISCSTLESIIEDVTQDYLQDGFMVKTGY